MAILLFYRALEKRRNSDQRIRVYWLHTGIVAHGNLSDLVERRKRVSSTERLDQIFVQNSGMSDQQEPSLWFVKGIHDSDAVSVKQIKNMAAAAVIDEETLIRRRDRKNWVKAGRQQSLFEKMWFYRDGTTDRGPISPRLLRKMISSGQIRAKTLLRHQSNDCWLEANEYPYLFGKSYGVSRAKMPWHALSSATGLKVVAYLVNVLGFMALAYAGATQRFGTLTLVLFIQSGVVLLLVARVDAVLPGISGAQRLAGAIASGCCLITLALSLMSAGMLTMVAKDDANHDETREVRPPEKIGVSYWVYVDTGTETENCMIYKLFERLFS